MVRTRTSVRRQYSKISLTKEAVNIARRHSFIRQYKLDDVCGRCDYIGNPDRQEHLYATYSTAEPEFWRELAEQNQYDFKRSNAKGKCIEARELVIALPESFQEYDRELLLQLFAEQFRSTYGVQCTAALAKYILILLSLYVNIITWH